MSGNNEAPYTFKERSLYKILTDLLGIKHFNMSDDLFELGMDDAKLESFIEEAKAQGIKLTAEEVREYRTLSRIIREKVSICFWENEYDPHKPVLVLVYGVAPYHYLEPFLGELTKRFSVLSIESLVEHWRYIFQNEGIGEVVDFYEEMIIYTLPEGEKVFGFLGDSYGGDIGYRLAAKWELHYGEHPHVYMLDTFLRVYDGSRFDEEKREMLEKLPEDERLKAAAYWNMSAYCLDVPKKLGDGQALPAYDGPVRLFSAMQVKDEPTLAKVLPVKAVMREDNPNVQAWKALVPGIQVDYVNADHLGVSSAPDFLTVFPKRLDEDLGRSPVLT